MSSKKRIKKTFSLFIIIFIAIIIIHTVHNVNIATRQPSSDWSRSTIIGSTSFNRASIIEFVDNNIMVFYPYKDGKGSVGIIRLDMDLQVLENYSVPIESINFNRIKKDDIKLVDNALYWRDYEDNTVYKAIFDENFKNVKEIEKCFEHTKSFDVIKKDEELYVAVADINGIVTLFNGTNESVSQVKAIEDINNIVRLKLFEYENTIYIQGIEHIGNSSKKCIFLTEYTDGSFSESIKLNEMLEIRSQIISMNIGVDKNYVYSIIIMHGQDQEGYTYYIDGYDRENKDIFQTFKLENDIPKKIYSLSGLPVILSSENNALEVITTSVNNLDIYSSSSNVIRLYITPREIEDVELISNTNSWSSNPVVLRDKGLRYIVWNEPGGFSKTYIKGASNKSSVINLLNEVKFKNVLLGIGEEVPILIYSLVICFGARLLWILPSLFYLLILFMFNDRIRNKKKISVIVGYAIFIIFQLMSMNFYYRYSSIMPAVLKFSGAKYLIPIIFTGFGIIGANIYKKEKKVDIPYKMYVVFLVFAHILMNYLYTPYVM